MEPYSGRFETELVTYKEDPSHHRFHVETPMNKDEERKPFLTL
jgi:hypothetical protein